MRSKIFAYYKKSHNYYCRVLGHIDLHSLILYCVNMWLRFLYICLQPFWLNCKLLCKKSFSFSFTLLLIMSHHVLIGANEIAFFYFFLATPRGLWDFSSLTRNRTQALGSESAESSPLDCQGIPLTNKSFFFLNSKWWKPDLTIR